MANLSYNSNPRRAIGSKEAGIVAFRTPTSGPPCGMGIDQIAPEALKLPLRDRDLLAASLWESIGDPPMTTAGMDDDEAIELALQRDGEIESGAVKPLTHQELMQRLRR
jgi:hypothetical protein